jgi:O-antigen ligase
VAALGIAVLLGAQPAYYRVQERFRADLASDGRIHLVARTVEAARFYMPSGSGMGSFVQVYPAFERPADGFVVSYVNRAHNDYLELWLESGLIRLAAMLSFLA